MSPWDVLGWVLVVIAGLFALMMLATTVVMLVRMAMDSDER